MRCRDKRWDRQIDLKKEEKVEKGKAEKGGQENTVLQEKLKIMEEERKKQDQMWLKN